MNLIEIISSRYSVRAYLPQEVETEKINFILECARLSPSACNLQPWHFYVVKEGEKRVQVQAAYDRAWFKTAPLYIVVCKDKTVAWERPSDKKNYADVDAAIAAEHICLAADEIGLGTCWVCNFDVQMLSDALSIPEHLTPIAMFPLGYIDKQNSKESKKSRKPLSQITTWI